MELWEKLKAVFVNWKTLLEQIPDTDRKESYRYDETLKKWVLLSTMPEAEVPILDQYRRLQVETPNFFEFTFNVVSVKIYGYFYEILEFLADSITVVCTNITTQSPIIQIYYYESESAETIGTIIYDKDGGETDNFIEQVDIKPYHNFRIRVEYGDGVGAGSSALVRLMFSKQKKTKISDTAYDEAVFNGIIDIGLSKNVFRDKIVSMDTLIGGNTTQTEVETIIIAELVEGQSIDNRIDALISALDHNDLQNINAGDDYEHITQTQKDALHTIVTEFIWRTPEPTEWDFLKENLIDDTNWNDFDLSSILPVGATAVYLRILFRDGTVGSRVQFRKNGQSDIYQSPSLRVVVANAYDDATPKVAVDSNRKCEIMCDVKPTEWTNLNILVVGWDI